MSRIEEVRKIISGKKGQELMVEYIEYQQYVTLTSKENHFLKRR